MNQELMNRIQSAISSEKTGIDQYKQLIEFAKQQNCDTVQHVICDILKEEETHLKMLNYLIDISNK